MGRISTSEARGKWAEMLDQVRTRGERVVIHKNGRDFAAVVPVEDLALLERLEDESDIAAARQALAENDFVTWEQVKADLAADRLKRKPRAAAKKRGSGGTGRG